MFRCIIMFSNQIKIKINMKKQILKLKCGNILQIIGKKLNLGNLKYIL